MIIKRDRLSQAVSVTHRLPENIKDADREDFAGEENYSTYDAYLTYLPNSRVSADSVVYKNGIVVRESLYSQEKRLYYQTRHLAKKLLNTRKITLSSSKSYLLATDQESTGHFHWLTEVLPRLWLIKDRASEFCLLLPDNCYVKTIGVESLEILGFHFSDTVFMRDDQFLKVKKLYHISKVSRTGQVHVGIMNDLRKAFASGEIGGNRRIYISRENSARRKVLNERELVAVLDRYGFEVFSGKEMSLRDQISLFAACETVIGIHGAGLTNCLFMKPGIVVELKKKEPNHGYWHLADSLDHKYYYYNGLPDSHASLIGQGCNLSIPLDRFEDTLLRHI